MLLNEILSVRTIYLLKCFNITTLEQLKKHTLKVGDKVPYYYCTLRIKQNNIDEINKLLN